MKYIYLLSAAVLSSLTFTACRPWASQKQDPSSPEMEIKEELVETTFPEGRVVKSKSIDSLNIATGKTVTLDEIMRATNSSSDTAALDAALAAYDKVVIDFYAIWCGPCKRLGPVFDSLATSRGDVLFIKVDVDKHAAVGQKYGVRSIPTILFIKNGSIVTTETGYRSAREFEAIIDNTLTK